MEDKNKTKAQLIQELKALRQQMTELEVERQGAETALQRSEARFQRFSEAAFEGIAIHEGGILVDANQALAKMFGYELAEMIGMNLLNLAAPEFHDIIREKIRAGSEESYEASGTKKDGTIIWVQLVSKPCYFQGRKARIASFKEITEYKRIEQELLESQKNLQTLFDSLDDYLFVLDVEGRILQVNPVVLSRLGYAKDELLGQSVFMVRPPDRREEVVATFVNAMAGKTDNCQIPLLTKSGQQIPVETKITMGSWGKQKVIFGVSRDMTVHEQVKEQLISEKNFSELLINSLPGIFYLFDANGKFLRWNNNFETVVGYSAEELSQMHPMEYIADEEKESAAKAIQKVFETGHADLETTFISRSGVKTPFYLTGIRIMVNGQPCLLGAGLDISEQKRAEDLLRVQRELGMGLLAAPKLDEALTICLETTLSASGMEAGGIYLVDETSGINLIYHCGLHPDFVQQVQHYDYDLNSPTVQLILAGQPIYFDSEQMTGPISRAPAGKDIRSLAIIPVQFEGQVIACLNVGSYTYSSVPDHARTTLEAIATQIGTAISRSQVEKALRESEARLALAIEASQAGYYILAADFSYMYVNERGAGNLGYRLDELPPSGPEKIAMWTGRIHPDDSPTVTQGFSEFLENKVETYQAEYRMQHKDGTWLWMSSMGTAIERDEQGKVIRMAGIIFDITAQKEAEAALRQSEEKLRSTLDSLSDLVFVFNQDGIFEEYYQPIDRPELYVPPEMFLGRHFKEVMPPHVSQLFEQAIAEIIEFHDIRQFDYSLMMNNQESWYSARCSRRRGEGGEFAGVTAVVRNITDQKQAEAALKRARDELEARVEERTRELRESEALFRGVSEQSPNMIFINIKGRVVYANEKCEEVTGYRREEFYAPDFNFLTLASPDTVDRIKGSFSRHRRGEDVPPYDFTLITKDGGSAEVVLATKLITFGGEQAIMGIMTDITARKQAELQIKASLKEKEALLKEIHHRVKNNLQVIASMLNMQTRYTEDEQAIRQLMESRNRVYSMALVHENLYRSETLARVDIRAYISDLINNILQAYGLDSSGLELELAVEHIFLDIDQAAPCGLIINELVSNALKHAFPKTGADRRSGQGKVTIAFHPEADDMLVLTVADNGVGLPEGLDLQAGKTLGLRLVRSLVRQLEATLAVDAESGTKFSITFRKMDES